MTSSHKFSCLFWVDLRWIFAQTSRRNPCWQRWCLMLRCRWFAVEIWMSNSKPPTRWMHPVLYISSKGRCSCAWFLTEIGNQWKHVYVCNERGHNIRHFANMFFSSYFFWPAFTWSFRSAYFVELDFCCLLYCLFGWLVDWLLGWLVG